MDVEDDSLKTVAFSPKSENTTISSSVSPNAIWVILAVSEIGFVMFAENFGFAIEYTLMQFAEAIRIRFDADDQENDWIDVEKDSGRGIVRRTSKDRVNLKTSLEG